MKVIKTLTSKITAVVSLFTCLYIGLAFVPPNTHINVIQSRQLSAAVTAKNAPPYRMWQTTSQNKHIAVKSHTALSAKYWDDMIRRGQYFMVAVILVTIWVFSIPVEFRRAILCTSENDINCVTSKEWIDGVVDYYRGGGGIQFDFSIDPETLARNGWYDR